jgi:2-aminoadipate transaminase
MATPEEIIHTMYSTMASRGAPGYWKTELPRITWSFDSGLPDPTTFPLDDFVRISDAVLHRDPSGALQYGRGTAGDLLYGYAGLRQLVIDQSPRSVGEPLYLRGVMLTSGGIQAITLAIQAFLDPTDIIAVEAPTWNMVVARIRQLDLEAIAVPLDEDGMLLDVLEERLQDLRAQGKRLKLLYTQSTFHSPTGVSLSVPRRQRLLELAEEYGFLILEDNVYGDLRYEGEVLPTLLSMDDAGSVMRIGSFSKTIAPGLRLGWISGHPEAIAAVSAIRGDLGVSQWMARVVAEYIREGLLEPHIAEVNQLYRQKRDLAASVLEQRCGPWLRFDMPAGGFNHWVELSDKVDPAAVKQQALAHGVDCRPGERFFGDSEQGKMHMRIAFSMVSMEEIERGLGVLGDAIEASLS